MPAWLRAPAALREPPAAAVPARVRCVRAWEAAATLCPRATYGAQTNIRKHVTVVLWLLATAPCWRPRCSYQQLAIKLPLDNERLFISIHWVKWAYIVGSLRHWIFIQMGEKQNTISEQRTDSERERPP